MGKKSELPWEAGGQGMLPLRESSGKRKIEEFIIFFNGEDRKSRSRGLKINSRGFKGEV